MEKFEVLLKKHRKTDSFLTNFAYFQQIFPWNKGNFGIPLFDEFSNFDLNKGKIPLFVFPYLDYTL